MIKQRDPLTTGEVAEYCHVTHRAVLKWIVSGKLRAYRTPGKHSRVEVKDFIDFLAKYNMPVPEHFRLNGQKKKILIVDDDEEMVNTLKRILKGDEHFEVEGAYDGFDAGRKFSDFRPDLVTLDIKMPGVDGYQVCSYIRKDLVNKDVKILVVSGVLDDAEAKKIMALGADDYLGKPFDLEVFQAKITKLLGMEGQSIRKDSVHEQ